MLALWLGSRGFLWDTVSSVTMDHEDSHGSLLKKPLQTEQVTALKSRCLDKLRVESRWSRVQQLGIGQLGNSYVMGKKATWPRLGTNNCNARMYREVVESVFSCATIGRKLVGGAVSSKLLWLLLKIAASLFAGLANSPCPCRSSTRQCFGACPDWRRLDEVKIK